MLKALHDRASGSTLPAEAEWVCHTLPMQVTNESGKTRDQHVWGKEESSCRWQYGFCKEGQACREWGQEEAAQKEEGPNG